MKKWMEPSEPLEILDDKAIVLRGRSVPWVKWLVKKDQDGARSMGRIRTKSDIRKGTASSDVLIDLKGWSKVVKKAKQSSRATDVTRSKLVHSLKRSGAEKEVYVQSTRRSLSLPLAS